MNRMKLGEILSVKHGWAFKGEYFAEDGEQSILTPGNFFEKGGFKPNNGKERYYTGTYPKEYLCHKGDLIVAMTQQAEGLLGSTALVPENNKYLHNQRIGLITCDEKRLNKLFAYYLFMTKSVREQLERSSSGTKVKHTSPEKIYDVEVEIPDVISQQKIANLLWAIDEKIANNNAINDNLEQQAKLIYDYWFTQFDFPDENGKPYCSSGGKMVWNEQLKRNIPENWNVVPLLKLVSWESNSQPPKSEFVYEPKEGYVRFIQNRDYDSDTHITYIPRTKNLSIVDRFDILMDKYGDAGAVRYGIEGAFNVALGKICVHNPNYREYIRSFLGSDGIYKFLHNSCMASTRASLSEANLAILNIVVPNEKIILDYENFLHKIRVSILKNKDETVELINLRDWLLPMLMNGQATIAD